MVDKEEEEEHFDCLLVGAGISGLDAAYHIQKQASWATFAILERRGNLGGTWDFFKYPGLRCDSKMYTFGFYWKPWESVEPIASKEEIQTYLREAAEEQCLLEKIKFNTDIVTAHWSSLDDKWHLLTKEGTKFSCNFLFGCTGYYSYENPYEPTFPGRERFCGPIVHPQRWMEVHDKMIVDKKVVLIGSGATAVTILPSIVDIASHVTMVQRSPTYIAAKPRVDPIAKFLKTWLPLGLALWVNRWIQVILIALFYQYCSWFPNHSKRLIKKGMYKELENVMSKNEFEKHFSPRYDPLKQRFCLAPDGDFFAAIREGKASIVTGDIEGFQERGIEMKNGETVEADFVISATGLNLQKNFPFSTIQVSIDGEEYRAPDHMIYNSMMISDVPNFAFVVGYANSSWTLKADIASLFFAKLLNYMKAKKVAKVVPREDPNNLVAKKAFNAGLTSSYFARARDILPKQGDRHPWKGGGNYFLDLFKMSISSLSMESLEITFVDKKNT